MLTANVGCRRALVKMLASLSTSEASSIFEVARYTDTVACDALAWQLVGDRDGK